MNRIKELRIQKGMKQEELAKLLNVQRPVVSKYENGSVPITGETISKLSEIFGVTTDYLLNLSNIPAHGESEDDEFWELRREMAERNELKTLFSLAKGATKEDLEFANKLLKNLSGGDK